MSTACKVQIEEKSQSDFENVGLIIPTFNAARHWPLLQASLEKQGFPSNQVLIIDSESPDETRILTLIAGYQFASIPQKEFGHGVTRQAACKYFPDAEIVVFMTQDAVLKNPESIEMLCGALEDKRVGAVYGRQLPRPDADPIERHARLFNYAAVSHVMTFESRQKFGIKAAFLSNSFAAYRKSALDEVGGFPSRVIMAEDSFVAARLLMAGYKVVYEADAMVFHSHPMTVREEFSRYFDTGVHHAREAWLLETFGTPTGEGLYFVRSELRYLFSVAPLWIPLAMLRTVSKLIGYRLGLQERRWPLSFNRFFSAHPYFWTV